MNGRAQVVVSTIMLAMLGWIIADQRGLRGEVRDLEQRMTRLEVSLSERMARLEGLFEGFTKREDE